MLLSTILFLPLVAAFALVAMPRSSDSAIRKAARLVAIADLLVSLPLWLSYDHASTGWQFVERQTLIAPIGFSYYLGVDGFSAVLVLLTTMVGAMAMWGWDGAGERVRQYYACLLLVQAGVLGALMALDFLVFLLFWTITLASIYYLVREWGSGERRRSAVTFLVVTTVSSVMLLAGILALVFYNHSIAGTYTFDVTQFQQLALPVRWQAWIFAAFFAGFAVMAAIFPLHAALRRAQSDAPAAVAVVVAALSLNLGAYGFIRFNLPVLPDASRSFAPIVTWLAVVSVVYTGLAALAQSDWKRLLAYASASQMGMIVAAIFALTPAALAGSVIQQIGHGLGIGGLFLLVGVMQEDRAAVASERDAAPIAIAAFSILALGAMMIPALAAFRYSTSRGWSAAAVAGVVLGAAAMLRLYRLTMSGRAANVQHVQSPISNLQSSMWPVVPLVASTIWIAAYPPAFTSRLDSSVSRVMARVNNTAPANANCDTPPAPPPPVPSPSAAASPPDFLTFAACGEDEKPSGKRGRR